MVAINDKIYFSAYRTGYGSELWQSNGTMQGTILIKDLIPGSESSFPTSFIEFKNDIYFSAGIKSANLPQPRNIFQFSPGSNIISAPFVLEEDAKDAFISPIVALGKKLFFTGEDSVHGVELWTSDGIPGSSHMVLDIVNGVNSSFPSNFIIKDSLLYFNAGPTKELWQSNGTPEGTKKVTIPNCPEFGPNNNCIVFPSKNRQKCWVLKNGALYKTNFNGDSVFVDNVNEFGILDKGNDLYYVNVKMNIVTLWKVSCSSNEPIAISKIDTVFLENQYGFFSKKYKILGEFADSNIIVQVHTKTWSINKISGEKHLLSNFIAYTECTDTTNYTLYLCEGGGVNMGTSVLSNGILFYTLGYQSREKPEFWNAYKLWRTDGTKEGTFLLDDRSELNKSLTVFGNGIIYRINFWANSPDPEFGATYVYSNGTKEGTYDIQGYNYKIQNKNFESHVVIENQLYFWGGLIDAKGIYKGAELWKYTLPGNENHRNSFSDDVIELEKSVSVYPNPAEDMLHILTDGSSKVHSAKIFNLAGILVSEQNSEKSNGVSTMKVEALETGLYIIKLLDESGNILLIDKIMVK